MLVGVGEEWGMRHLLMHKSDAMRVLLTHIERQSDPSARRAAGPDAHDAWFRVRVHEALMDRRPGIAHEDVVREARALIQRKRR